MDTPSLSLIVLGMLEERVDGILKAMVNFSPLVEVWSIITLYTLADVEHYELARYWAATEVECCSMVFGFRILILCSTYSNILYFNCTLVYYMYLYLCIYIPWKPESWKKEPNDQKRSDTKPEIIADSASFPIIHPVWIIQTRWSHIVADSTIPSVPRLWAAPTTILYEFQPQTGSLRRGTLTIKKERSWSKASCWWNVQQLPNDSQIGCRDYPPVSVT